MKSLMLLAAVIACFLFPAVSIASEIPNTIQIDGKFYTKGLNGIYTECKECNQTTAAVPGTVASPASSCTTGSCFPQSRKLLSSVRSSCGNSSGALQVGACGSRSKGPIRSFFAGLFSCGR